MDNFDFDSLDSYIKRYKHNIVTKLENIQLNEKTLKNQADLLCLVLDYSPRVIEDRKSMDKIKISNNTLLSDSCERGISNRSLILDNKPSEETEENEDESKDSKDGNIKMSTFSKRVSSTTYYAETVYLRNLILNLIQIAVDLGEKKKEEKENEEDEYLNQLEQRRKKLEEQDNRRSSKKNSLDNEKAVQSSKFATKFSESVKIRVYLLNNPSYSDFVITINETFKDLKQKVLCHLMNEGKMKLKYHVPDAYEIRLFEEDEEMPNMEFPALDDKSNVFKSGNNTVAFVEKIKFNPETDVNFPTILGSVVTDSETKITLKIYFKMEKEGSKSTILQESGEKTLKNVLERLSSKSKINYKNFDLYYFVEHVEQEKEENEDMDNAINIETALKFLNHYELDLYFKKFPDVPESCSYSQYSQRLVNYNEFHSANPTKHKNEEDETGREYVFNDISAGLYQEFDVIKINKYKTKQERTLGIDLYNLYNDLPKNKPQNNLRTIFYQGTKKPLRKITDITKCGYLTTRTFFIEMTAEGSQREPKQIIFEVKNVNVRNEIVAKIEYLIVKYSKIYFLSC